MYSRGEGQESGLEGKELRARTLSDSLGGPIWSPDTCSVASWTPTLRR